MFKRIALFLATNLAVLVLLGIVLSVLQGVFGITLGNNGQPAGVRGDLRLRRLLHSRW